MLVTEKVMENANISILEIKEYNEKTVQEGLILFNDYKEKNIILNKSLDDNIWYLNNESTKISMHFNFNEIIFNKEAKFRKFKEYKEFICAIKLYALYCLKNRTISSLRTIINEFEKIFNESNYLNSKEIDTLKQKKINSNYYIMLDDLIDFLDFYDMAIDDEVFNLFEYQIDKYNKYCDEHSNNQRELGNLESIFKLGDIIDVFWNECSSKEKEKFFPIKLWWEITTIIPIRVTEFAITPYDCLREDKDKNSYYITVRRSNLKGNSEGTVTHKIETDYIEQEIRINKHIYDLINEYKECVDEYDFIPNFGDKAECEPKRREFLLSKRSYIENLQFKESSLKNTYSVEVFDRNTLRTLLNYFYRYIVLKKYKFKLIKKNYNNDLASDEIEVVNLMDTRHYAFINLVLNDIEPMIIKKISGHKSIQSSYHYYNHVAQFIKCYTYSMARRMAIKKNSKKDTTIIQLNNSYTKQADLTFKKIFGIDDDREFNQLEGGRCYSKSKCFEDCLKINNDCIACDFYEHEDVMSEQVILDRIEDNYKQIDTEIEDIKLLLGQYKKIKNADEQYKQKINKIKGLSNQNSKLLSKYIL